MLADSMAAPSAVFDHETESRGRRPAPDWGGDDLFDHVPRRRFAPSQDAAGRRREGSADPAAARRRREGGAEHRPSGPRPAPVEELVQARRAEYAPRPVAANGRRTVTVTGRPGPAFAPRTARPARRREPRTVEERIGARPDQVAGWAFALGVLLIFIALLV